MCKMRRKLYIHCEMPLWNKKIKGIENFYKITVVQIGMGWDDAFFSGCWQEENHELTFKNLALFCKSRVTECCPIVIEGDKQRLSNFLLRETTKNFSSE